MITPDTLKRLKDDILKLLKDKKQCPVCGNYVNLTFYSPKTGQFFNMHITGLHADNCTFGEVLFIETKISQTHRVYFTHNL